MPLTARPARLTADFNTGKGPTMTDRINDDNNKQNKGGWWRLPLWGGAAALLAIPAVAMAVQVEGWAWSPFDFAIMGALLAGAAGAIDLLMRASGDGAYRLAAVGTVGAALLMTWVDLAVGLLGPEGGLSNMLLLLVPVTGVVGAVIGRFRAGGMARTALAMLAVQLAVGALALTEPATAKGFGWPWHILAVSGVFGAGWLLAWALFSRAARAEAA